MTPTKVRCSLCDVSFDNTEQQRLHAKSDSHIDNLRRRIAAAETFTLPTPKYRDLDSLEPSETPDEQASSESSSDYEVEEDEMQEFNPSYCIFCPHHSESFELNQDHMKTAHGLRIPFQENLTVEQATLIWYLHLVIFGYHECILCGARKRTVEAVQQHMLGKGHCRFEVSDEMLEFYDLEKTISYDPDTDLQPNEESMRLPSGKVLSHRSQNISSSKLRTLNQRKALDGANGQDQDTLADQAAADALTTRDRKDMVLATQLSRLSVRDQQNIMHLPISQQRNLLAQRKREFDAIRRADRKMQRRTDWSANKISTKFFKNDVPGRACG
ncbi:hypothetical protein FZEAL_2086 [Fusarium zealandicum]|uniref:C2H2-type domain-containing protein n=1 Tax=Fusarium zealandicum TaxID=1053134 RepID=A0A8H4XNV9_9HYPO|nr:hypothetical protein FZEAL_2086 [Fusarium zealandicum]